MNDLTNKNCVPCKTGTAPFSGDEIKKYLNEVKDWQAINKHHLVKKYSFSDFISALSFVNRVGKIAEQENHHPNICFTWGMVEITIWTHRIGGLHENDFILASKLDELL